MLGYHTKQVTTYGKRRQRIVNVDDDRVPRPPPTIFDDLPPTQWAPVASRMKKRENGPKASPQILHMSKKKPAFSSPVDSRLGAMRSAQARRLAVESRRPLGLMPLNTPGSPAPRLAAGKGVPPVQALFTPVVDIIVLDGEGKTVSKERRISGPRFSPCEDDSPPQPRAPRRGVALKKALVIESDESDSDEESIFELPPDSPPRKVITVKKAVPLRIESDESDADDSIILPVSPAVEMAPLPIESDESDLDESILLPVSPVVISQRPTTPIVSNPVRYQRAASPIPRPRQLTPIRRRGLYAPPSPPSPLTPSDGNLSIDLSDLSLSLSTSSGGSSLVEDIPEYLQPLLAECSQSLCGLHEFSAFIKSFPFDPLVSAHKNTAQQGFRKIGEASYSEVFGIGDVVLKVIPLRDETQRRLRNTATDVEGPAETDAKDVLKEIIVTRAMGDICDGFVKLLRAYVVRGTYPQVLLELWDEYLDRKGSEGVRPDTFAVSQAYAIIVLPNGGPDLEASTFAAKSGWRQACSVFWQVAKALAHAEQLVSFEHRDLHLGQILVKDVGVVASPLQAVNQNRRRSVKPERALMDDAVHGVRATLIDLGLSRMDAGDGSGGETVHWTPFEEEIFMGEGDYQFDIYRCMRDHNGNNWEAFNPLTNALWLHYLIVKLLKSKGLKAPARRKTQSTPAPGAAFTERDCYECLIDLEDWLGNCVSAVVEAKPKGKGRKKKAAPATPAPLLRGPLCAGEVVGYGVKKGWVRSLADRE
ncbi:hypothetical protein FB45DRAFT_827867 [Roridomyces roridus]|uniref:non-specific serine/threonine protein kinase n=1 Tax=Roridomyces roridus TaxID=1738132 RepID=A0AAD7C5A3_9AGAR|nr:hypothetical protein FB45DRAFT_827867 [Roridomyces roridus]